MLLDRRLLFPSLAVWISTALFLTGEIWQLVGFIVATFAVVAVISKLPQLKKFQKDFGTATFSQIAITSVLVIIALSSSFLHEKIAFPSQIQGAIDGGNNITVIAKIESEPTLSQGFSGISCSFQATANQINQFNEPQGGKFKITAAANGDICESDDFKYASKLELSGVAKGDDFHLGNAMKLQIKEHKLISNPPLITNFFNIVRESALKVAKNNQKQFPALSNAVGLTLGMSLGDKRLLNSDFVNASKIAGLTHLTAISGTHFIIVISAVGAIFAPMLRTRRRALAIVQIVSIIAMTLLVHPTDSVKRASVMSAIALLGIFAKRRSQSIAVLSFVVIGWILFDPFLAVSFSFALSVSAAGSIVLFSGKCRDFLARFFGSTFAELISVPLTAQLGCTPVLLLMNNYLTPLAPLANLAVVPVVQAATLLSFAAVLFSVFCPPISSYLNLFGAVFTKWIEIVALTTSNFPFSKLPWSSGFLGTIELLILCCGIVLIPKMWLILYEKITGHKVNEETAIKKRTEKQVKKLTNKTKKYVKIKPVFSIGIVILTIISIGLISYSKAVSKVSVIPQNWLIVACDVGQGDSAVLRTGEHSAILVDAGPNDNSTGGRGVDSCLTKLEITKIDIIFLSHFHSDHIGGLESAIQNRKVEKAILDPVRQPSFESGQVDAILHGSGIEEEVAENSMSGEVGCSENVETQYCVKWEVISIWDDASEDGELFENGKPIEKTGTKTSGEDDRENDSSVAILFTVNGVTYFTAGDLELKGSHGALLQLEKRGFKNVDVLKVNHHGSKTQNEDLLNLLNPQVAIYMVGKNDYGHPNEKTVSLLEKLGAKTIRTDKKGICGILIIDEKLSTFCEQH